MTDQGSPVTLANTLALHGIPFAVATKIVEIGRALRGAHSADGNEHAAMLEIASGDRIAPDITGQRDRVDLRPHLDTMQAGQSYIQIHSHRSGVTVSLEDIALLVLFPAIPVMVVVANDGYWYILSVPAGVYPAPVVDIETTMWEAFFALRPSYAARVTAGEMALEQAGRALWDEVWRTVSVEQGFLYHQVRE